MTKVSIIVPVYKVERFIDRCIKSLQRQTLSDIEIILVDDGSPDSCPQVCDKYAMADNRIHVIHKNNEGLALARNSGIDVAKGEYIAFLDSDDYVDEKMYQELYNEAVENSLDGCFCDVINFDYNGNFDLYPRTMPATKYLGRNEVDKFATLQLVADKSSSSPVFYPNMSWNGIYKRSIIASNKLRFKSERIYVSEDVLFHLESLPYFNRIGWIEKPLVYHYMSNFNSLTNTVKPQKIQAALNMIDIVKERTIILYPQNYDMQRAVSSYAIKLINDISHSISTLIINPFTRFQMLYRFLSNAYGITEDAYDLVIGVHRSKMNVALKYWSKNRILPAIVSYNILSLKNRIKLFINKFVIRHNE